MAEEREDKKRGRTWEKEETVILLGKWGEDNIQQRLKECTRKKPIWQEISNFLSASGYDDRDCDSCLNENSHINLGLQRLQRSPVEVRQRYSEKEGTIF